MKSTYFELSKFIEFIIDQQKTVTKYLAFCVFFMEHTSLHMLQIRSIPTHLYFGVVLFHFISSAKKDISLMISLIFDVMNAKYIIFNKL